jgi:DNA topoisomerase VI subunit B
LIFIYENRKFILPEKNTILIKFFTMKKKKRQTNIHEFFQQELLKIGDKSIKIYVYMDQMDSSQLIVNKLNSEIMFD